MKLMRLRHWILENLVLCVVRGLSNFSAQKRDNVFATMALIISTVLSGIETRVLWLELAVLYR